MSIFLVHTGIANTDRTLAELETEMDVLLAGIPETDFALKLTKGNTFYVYEKGIPTVTTKTSWHSASKMLQACAALYQIKKGVLALTDTFADIFAAYSTAFPGENIPAYTGDGTIQDALDFSTGYALQSRNAGNPSGTNIPQPKAWILAVASVPSNATQSAPAGTDGSAEYSTGQQCHYGAAILAELIRTGATYQNALDVSTPFVSWLDVWADFIINEAPFLLGTQVGTTYFTSSDVIKKCTIDQYMQVLVALDDTSSSDVFLTQELRNSVFTDNIAYRTQPMVGGVSISSWYGIDCGWNGTGGWVRPPGDEDVGDVETSGLAGQFTKISRRDGFKLAIGPVSTNAVTDFPGGFTIYTRNGELRALVREWSNIVGAYL